MNSYYVFYDPVLCPHGRKQLAAEPVTKSEERVPPAAPGLRIPLGKNCDTKKDVYWDPFTLTPKKLANQHVLIVGKSGAGKTQSAAAFIVERWKFKVPRVIFDFQGEYIDASLANAAHETFGQLPSYPAL